jgi:ribonucleoside-diphosphate reductase alpha chain
MNGGPELQWPPSMKLTPLAGEIWASKYRYSNGKSESENNIGDTWRRVARAVAAVEADQHRWEKAFLSVLSDFAFLPGGRVLAGAGTGKQVTLFNCFVCGPIRDSIGSILDSLKETALTMHQGGGIGCDFSGLRPSGSAAVRTGSVASGPLPFMRLWDSLCHTLLATSNRRGAMMGTLRCDHPDVRKFIDAKRASNVLTNFNLSVLITDDFMQAVADDADWQLTYPNPAITNEQLAGEQLPARTLWRQIVEAAHETAEPGLLFVDRINRENNLHYCEKISATNPCGEIPLPPYGACDLGSINLTAFVQAPFSGKGRLDRQRLVAAARIAVRFLDDVIDVSHFPLKQQSEQALGTRRVGLGITGLADSLAMLGMHYDSDEAREFAARTIELIRDTAYETSVGLANEKGAFPLFSRDEYLQAPFIQRLPGELRKRIAADGIRNSHLLAIAPAGTISLLAGNISSGIEPIYALEAKRAIRGADLKIREFAVRDCAYSQWVNSNGRSNAIPDAFVTAESLPAKAHLAMQSCLQPYVDNAISKTVNLPARATPHDVDEIFSLAYSSGLKGCTVFRHGARQGQVIRARDESHCCHVEREAD